MTETIIRAYTKKVYGCSSCPHFWGESETCKHPIHKGKTHVVDMYVNNRFDTTFTFPHDCPLPIYEDNNG